MENAEIVVVLHDLYFAAAETGLDDVAKRIADNIAVFTEAMKREAARKQKLVSLRSFSPWWLGLSEESFKKEARAYLSRPGGSAEKLKELLAAVAGARGIWLIGDQMRWTDEVAAELASEGGGLLGLASAEGRKKTGGIAARFRARRVRKSE